MGRHKRFVDNFWLEDFTSTAPFDALSQHMRDGRKLCKEIKDYLQQRSKIESQYVKDLQKLNKQDFNKEDIGALESAWKDLKVQTENIAHVHELAARQFQNLSNEIATFNADQKKITTEHEDKVSKLHSAAKSTYAKVNNQHRVYLSKFEDNEKASHDLKYSENMVTAVTPKEMDKLRTKADKAKDELEKADNLYKTLVRQVQDEMALWEQEMGTLCNKFQGLEEKRIDHLRDYLWKCTNIDSQANVDHDQCCEHVRMSLEKCNIDSDIDHFIDKNRTGSSRPARVEYRGHGKTSPKVKDRGRLPSLPKQSGHIYADINDI